MIKQIEVSLFIFVTIFIFLYLQKMFIPSWNYPEFPDNVEDSIQGFYDLPKNSLQVLFLGTSHVGYSVSPVQLYKDYGITSYNLGTSDQGFDTSLLLLRETFKTQHPKLIILDVSKLFSSNSSRDCNKVRDNIPINCDKIRFVLSDGNGYGIRYNLFKYPDRIIKLVPFYEYHNRWNQLSYNYFSNKKNRFLLGYSMFSQILPFDSIINEDIVSESVSKRNKIHSISFFKDEYYEMEKYCPFYETEINETAKIYITNIKKECKKNNAKLVLIKIPNKFAPQYYLPTWTKEKHDLAVNYALQEEIPFYDLKYDYELGINWSTDTVDYGQHLNYKGAQKVTTFIGQLIKQNYLSESRRSTFFNNKILYYNDLEWICNLQLEDNFSNYISYLKNTDRDLIVFFAVSEEAIFSSSESIKKDLTRFGFQTNFMNIIPFDSFIGIFDNKKITYECTSNREQDYTYFANTKKIQIQSSGWETVSLASIKINGIEEALNQIGLNIVVYDTTSDMVIDSVCFDFCNKENYKTKRDNNKTKNYFFKYYYYLMKKN